ncbi:unnamed protein product [Withania somnifera]
MAKSQVLFCSALFFCFLIASTEMKKAEAYGCGTLSATWEGACLIDVDCNTQCINLEGAVQGACYWEEGWRYSLCYCYFC